MKLAFTLILQFILLPGLALAQGKLSDSKEELTSRPSVFPELDLAKRLCMSNCPSAISNFMGVEMVCENQDSVRYGQNCSDLSNLYTTQYCNCLKGSCASFTVSCTGDGHTCHVVLNSMELKPEQCACNGRTCASAGQELCITRLEGGQNACSYTSLSAAREGKVALTTCDQSASCNESSVRSGVMYAPLNSTSKPSEDK